MKYCDQPFNFLYIRPSGTVRLCGWMTKPIGNLLEDDLGTIWNGEAARDARESIRDGSYRYCLKGSCPRCENDLLRQLPDDLDEAALEKYFTPEKQPLQISCSFDYTCNHSCPSCRHGIFVPDEQYRQNMEKIYQHIKPYLPHVEWLDTDGQGDVFASPIMMKMLEELHPVNPKFVLNLETNGVLFDEAHWARIEHLAKFPIDVTVTPNSFERATYKYLSGGHDNLDKLLHNLDFISSLRQEGKLNQFSVSIVVQDRNFRELPAFCERCLNEFKADKVIIKPVYRWFRMTEEEYLSKDILNPAHPYFEEYMDVWKDPRLDDPRIFWWGAKNIHPKTMLAEERLFKLHEASLQWMELTAKHPAAFSEYLKSKGYHKVGIYGYDRLGKLLRKELKEWEPVVISDRFKQTDPEVQTIHTTQERFPEMDALIVSRFFEFDRLVEDIRTRTDAEIIPLDKLIEQARGFYGDDCADCGIIK